MSFANTFNGFLRANNDVVALNVGELAAVGIDIRGTFAGTITFEVSINGENWVACPMLAAGSTTNAAVVTTTTAAGLWFGSVAGFSQFRVRMSPYTSGMASVTIRAEEEVALVWNLSNGATAGQTIGSIAAGTNAIGDVGIQYRANNTGAATASSILSPATPAGAVLKSGAARLIGWQLQNSAAAIRSVKFYNATAVTMGTTSALFEVDIPAGGRTEVNLPGGIGFATGLAWAVTGAKGLTDNTGALAANDVSGAVFWA